MRFTLPLFLSMLSSVLAGQNCKCQDPSGTGPQYDGLTQQCCGVDGCSVSYYPGPNHQVCLPSQRSFSFGPFPRLVSGKGMAEV
jgi:hypothetical protein